MFIWLHVSLHYINCCYINVSKCICILYVKTALINSLIAKFNLIVVSNYKWHCI